MRNDSTCYGAVYACLMLLLLAAAPLCAQEKKKVVVLGYDALDPVLMQQFMDQGHLPNFKKLSEQGHYSKLETSYPPMSPSAWSTMVTGLNPGRTGITGFVGRRPGSYEPQLDLVIPNESPFLGGNTFTRAAMALGAGLVLLALGILLGKLIKSAFEWFGFAPRVHAVIPASACLGILLLSPLPAVGDARMVGAAYAGILILAAIWGYGAVRLRLGLRTWLFPYLGLSVAVFALLVRMPQSLPQPVSGRQGESFWTTAGKDGFRAKVLGGPVEWPARTKANVSLTTGLATPDVMGTHHTYSLFTEPPHAMAGEITEMGGRIDRLEFKDNVAKARLLGPPARFNLEAWKRWEQGELDVMPREEISFEIRRGPGEGLTLAFPGQPLIDGQVALKVGEWTPHLRLVFNMGGLAKLNGTVRLKLLSGGNAVRLYAQPVQFDPLATPEVFAVAAPSKFGEELAEEFGLYDTVGWSEATSALNDGSIDEQTFLETCDHAFEERKKQLLPQLERPDEWDMLICFCYEIDRICHMLWRHMDAKHPAHDPAAPQAIKDGIRDAYIRADKLVGEVMAKLPRDCVLLVVSDHGFAPFYASVNLNRWLLDHGYLALNKPTKEVTMEDLFTGKSRYFGTYDWTRTRVYSMGLGKIYINLKGREPSGIVQDGEAAIALREEVRRGLLDLRDANGQRVIREVRLNTEVWEGPMLENDCDLIVLFESGYRISWQTTLGGAHEAIIAPNLRNWSGDHCTFAPEIVPGVVFSNRKLEAAQFRLVDVGDTVLKYFGVTPNEQRRNFDAKAWTIK